MKTTYKEINGIEVANSDKFWGAYFADRAKMLKGALAQTTGCMIEYGDATDDYNNRVFVDIHDLPFRLVSNIHAAAHYFAQDLNILAGCQDSYYIESKFTSDGRLILEIHQQ